MRRSDLSKCLELADWLDYEAKGEMINDSSPEVAMFEGAKIIRLLVDRLKAAEEIIIIVEELAAKNPEFAALLSVDKSTKS